MAIRPDYAVGTVSLTLGSKDFTTVGASLESAAVTGGDTIMTADGLVLIIDEVTGQNSGTLLNESPVTVVDEPLVIRFQPDGSKYQGAARDLIARWGQNGNVDAFAGLVGVVDGVPVFTGVGTMELVDKSEFVTPDPNGNLAELAGIAKQNDQFIVMGDDGSVQLMAISDITDDIAANSDDIAANTADISSLDQSKFNKPSGTTSQYLQGDGTADSKTNLPISTSTQNALNGKLSLTGGTMTGDILFVKNTPATFYVTPDNSIGYRLMANISNGIDYGWHVGAGYEGDEILVVRSNSTVSINGTLSKSGGTFDIDHPCDPFNKNLRHGFVESTEYLNLYRGLVTLENGRMDIDVDAAFGMSDGTFAALNADVMVTSLQNQNGFDRVCIQGNPSTGKFTIVCENETSTADVAWMVSGRRKDAFVLNMDINCERGTGRFIPEYEKEDA